MSNGELPFDTGGVLVWPMVCPRCGTPLALVAESDERSIDERSEALASAARELTTRLQLYRAGETMPAYLEVRRCAATPPDRVLLVWPVEHRSVLSAEDFANVRPLLQRLHRCLALPRLY